ncbi:hypothetical protein [Paenibacillus sp. NAIST15-1]|uniref:hypothetical protein n=1 Tax=Paenibacillus sp. NAIST15-1 TaxID=1605994 RepID=UPI00086EB128|nr:hypothetical protein [Paenibacillus sp. NAIST15-1]GAV11271.1 putative EF-hand-like domain protein [Paenibacillus sp. NAIST15-1]
MDNLIIISVVTLAFVVGLFVVPYLSKKGMLTSGFLGSFGRSTFIAKVLLRTLKLDEGKVDKVNAVLDIADMAVDYVNKFVVIKDSENTQQITLDAIKKVLKKLDIKPTEDELELIKIIVEESLNWHDRR